MRRLTTEEVVDFRVAAVNLKDLVGQTLFDRRDFLKGANLTDLASECEGSLIDAVVAFEKLEAELANRGAA